jgi:DNA polymerase III epsilon subunit family exonuclease
MSDPAETPEVVNLAERLIEADRSTGGRQGTWIQPMAGLDLALRRMLVAAGFKLARDEASARLLLGPGDGGSSGLPLRLFKALQLLHSREFAEGVREFVAFDLETTDRDVTSCEIVEVGAVKVVDGKVVDRFHALVRPDKAVSALATEVHGYTGAALQGSPRFADVWQKFRDFAGDHLLVAHNGLTFDVPVLLRMAAGFDGVSGLVFFDTLPLARSLFRGSRRLQDLAERFGIPAGRSHHAQDDAETLAAVFGRLARQKTVRARKSSLANLLDWLGLAMGLEAPRKGAEAELLTTISAAYTLGRYSDCLELYAADRLKDQREDAPAPDDVIREIELRSGLKRKNLQADKKAADRYPEALARLERLLVASEAPTLDDSVRRFLEQVTLSISDGVDADHHRVNLLTLHATKGLEFSRVYVVGVEDAVIPGLRELEENRVSDIQEARRLLYVGMTRAMDRLILTHCDRRGGDTTGGTRFLNEMGLTDGTITVGRADGQAVVSELVPILQPSSRPGV